MKGCIDVSAKLNDEAIREKLNNLLDAEAGTEIHNLLATMCDPYVPFLEGPLSQTIEVTPYFVRYTQPYAHYQYNGEGFNHTLEHHPLASAKWDEAMLRDKRDEFLAGVKEILVRRAKELYG